MKKIVYDPENIQLYDENWQLITSVAVSDFPQLSQYGVEVFDELEDFAIHSDPSDNNSTLLAVELFKLFPEVMYEG